MSRQQRRAEERATAKREGRKAFMARLHNEVAGSETVRDLWLVYYRNRFETPATRPLEPEHIALLQEVFYSGVAAMFDLVYKAGDVGDSAEEIDRGAAKLQRLLEELETYTKSLK